MPHSHVHWRPTAKDSYLGYDIKWAIARKLWDHDGTLTSDWTAVSRDMIPFLEGVVAGDRARDSELTAEVQKLIALIEQHGTVELALIND